jgi:hypothetical protein
MILWHQCLPARNSSDLKSPASVDAHSGRGSAAANEKSSGSGSVPAACTVKQQACRIALASHPQAEGETDSAYSRRIAPIAGVSFAYVHCTLATIKCERKHVLGWIGARNSQSLGLSPAKNLRRAPRSSGWGALFQIASESL